NLFILFPILSGCMFGASGIFVRTFGSFGMDNITITFARAIFATAIMFFFLMIKDKTLLKINIKDIWVFLGTGIIGMFGVTYFYNEAVSRVSLALAAILLSLAPIFVMLMAMVLFDEKITLKKMGCMMFAVGGCVLASGIAEEGAITVSVLGIAMGLVSAVFYGLYSIFSRKATDKGYHTYTIIFYSVMLITMVLIPFADISLICDYAAAAPFKRIPFLILHSLSSAVLPYILLTIALKHIEVGVVSILASGGEPIAAVIFGIFFYSEVPSLLMVAGLIVTIAALSLLCLPNKKEKT
ncbi:MAG: DMT family transporter, partial [Firmicutes bacterium]|nr:DMT family transporter [Bacillota bacterium]